MSAIMGAVESAFTEWKGVDWLDVVVNIASLLTPSYVDSLHRKANIVIPAITDLSLFPRARMHNLLHRNIHDLCAVFLSPDARSKLLTGDNNILGQSLKYLDLKYLVDIYHVLRTANSKELCIVACFYSLKHVCSPTHVEENTQEHRVPRNAPSGIIADQRKVRKDNRSLEILLSSSISISLSTTLCLPQQLRSSAAKTMSRSLIQILLHCVAADVDSRCVYVYASIPFRTELNSSMNFFIIYFNEFWTVQNSVILSK